METENKSHELDKNRDKNPAGSSTLGGKAWPDDKYPNFFLRISCDNNNILFPWNQAQFFPLVVQELRKFFFFSYLVNLPQILTPNVRQGQDSTPLPSPHSPTSIIRKYTWDPKKSILCPRMKSRLETVAPNPSIQ